MWRKTNPHHTTTMKHRSTQSSSSAMIIGNNDDLLIKILQFVPAKSLIKFKSVSKQWRSLISCDFLARLHYLNHPAPQHSFFILGLYTGIRLQYFMCDPTTVRKLVKLSFPFPNVKILQSCDGLLLLRYGKCATSLSEYCVFNPTTWKYRLLIENGCNPTFYLLFDPSKSQHYKVVRWDYTNRRTYIRFSVCDSATNKWSIVSEIPDTGQNFSDGVSCKNRIYFITSSGTHYFSPEENKMCGNPISPSLYLTEGGRKDYAVESNGHFHYVSLLVMAKESKLDVYEMVKGNKWLHYLSGDMKATVVAAADEKTTRGRLRQRQQVEFLCMIRGERIEDSVFLLHVPGQILVFRYSDKSCTVLFDFRSHYFFEEDQLQFTPENAHSFVHSSASV